jgi:hypothetical protein
MKPHSAINELREEIDACRPGSADLALPGLARLADAAQSNPEVAGEIARSQRFDGLLAEALDDVPIPAGLAERLLARAASQRLQASVEAALVSADPAATSATVSLAPATESADLAASPERPTRRRVLWRFAVAGSVALAMAAIALVVGPFVWGPAVPRVVSQQDLLAEAGVWMDQSAAGNVVWRKATEKAPEGFAKPTAVVVKTQKWRSFRTGTGDAAVAHDLSVGNTRATLFVVATTARYPVGPLPFTTVPGATGGRQIAGWQSSTHLYVLVIEAGPAPEQYLRRPSLG